MFAVVWMLIGVAFYSILIGLVSAFFTSKDTKHSLLAKRVVMVEEFCKKLGIDADLEEKIKSSLAYSSDKLAYLWLSPDEDIFNGLNMQLKYEFLVAVHKRLIQECEFFRNKDISFVVRIVPLLKPVKYRAGDTIWKKGDHSNSRERFLPLVYFLVEGQVTFYFASLCSVAGFGRQPTNFDKGMNKLGQNQETGQSLNLKVLEAISYFGESDIFLKKERRFDALASKDSHVMLLARIDFESIVKEEFPHVYRELSQIAIEKYDRELKLAWEIKGVVKASCPELELDDSDEEEQAAADLEEQPFLRLTLQDLFEQSKDRFPIEELLQGDAGGLNDSTLDFERVKTGEIEVLAREFRGSCR